jgi:hypothetical protein
MAMSPANAVFRVAIQEIRLVGDVSRFAFEGRLLALESPVRIGGRKGRSSDLFQKSVAELTSHGSSLGRTQEELPALSNQNDEDAARGEAGRQFRSEFLNQVTSGARSKAEVGPPAI